jgi:hypothetical protein
MGKRIGLALCLMIAGEASGGLLPVKVGVTPEGADFRYTYSIQLQSGAVLQPGDYFTIFDFAGLLPNHQAQPVGFDYASSPTGTTPARLNPVDDAGVANLTWTYSGATVTGPLDLGTFSALSQYGETTDGAFTGQTHRQVDGHLNGNITDTRVPVPAGPGVPEPSAWLLLIAGVPVLIGLNRLHRRRA